MTKSDIERVGAVVVSFHPSIEDIAKIRLIADQADLLVVVDNHSGDKVADQLRLALIGRNVSYVFNPRNLGIAAALNIGVDMLLREGCTYIALFDQDSEVTGHYFEWMIEDFRVLTAVKPIAQLIPTYLDPETSQAAHTTLWKDGRLFLTITSGSVFHRTAFERCGFFTEELFIYCVDDDFSLRLHEAGLHIGQSERAVLHHLSGRTICKEILGLKITTKNYRPLSRYYYARNKVWLLRKWGAKFPRLVIPTVREFFTIPFKILIAETDVKRKLGMFYKGLWHGLAGRTGAWSGRFSD